MYYREGGEMVNWEPVYTISANTTVREHLINVKKLNQRFLLSPLPQLNVTRVQQSLADYIIISLLPYN